MARRLLLVSYWYPPAVGAAAERMYGLARHLPAHGWRLDILTAQPDPPALANVCVHAVADPLAGRWPVVADYAGPPDRPTGSGRLRSLVFPDRFAQWAALSYRAGLEIVREGRPEFIVASFPPASCVQLALRLHRATGCPLVLDFRDLWIGPGGYAPSSARAAAKHDRLQRAALAESAGLVGVSEPLVESLRWTCDVPGGRTFVLENGFEPTVCIADEPAKVMRAGSLTIAHLGTVIPRNRPDLFFRSLQALDRSGKLGDARFSFVGNLSAEYVARLGLADRVQTTGLIGRAEALRLAQWSGALLLLTGEYVGRWGYSAKLFEYLRMRRPILCLEEVPGSNDRLLLESVAPERSFFAAIDSPGEIAAQLDRLRAFVLGPGRALVDPAGLDRFSRKTSAARLSRFLETIAAAPAPS